MVQKGKGIDYAFPSLFPSARLRTLASPFPPCAAFLQQHEGADLECSSSGLVPQHALEAKQLKGWQNWQTGNSVGSSRLLASVEFEAPGHEHLV